MLKPVATSPLPIYNFPRRKLLPLVRRRREMVVVFASIALLTGLGNVAAIRRERVIASTIGREGRTSLILLAIGVVFVTSTRSVAVVAVPIRGVAIDGRAITGGVVIKWEIAGGAAVQLVVARKAFVVEVVADGTIFVSAIADPVIVLAVLAEASVGMGLKDSVTARAPLIVTVPVTILSTVIARKRFVTTMSHTIVSGFLPELGNCGVLVL